MDKPSGPHTMYLAPGAPASAQEVRCPGDGASALQLPGPDRAWPRVDDYVVEPETGTEMIDGVIVEVSPSGRAHGVTQATLARLLGAAVTDEYEVATELLTRTSERWNFAADACILRRGADPESGGRYLEEVVFEVRDSQRPGDLERRAKQLSDRGVRRIFVVRARLADPDHEASAIVAGPVEEWSAADQSWTELDAAGSITDPTLRHPIAVQAFLDATEASRELTRAVLARRDDAVLLEHERTIRDAGKADGLREAVEQVCQRLDIALTSERRTYLGSLDVAGLSGLLARLAIDQRWVD